MRACKTEMLRLSSCLCVQRIFTIANLVPCKFTMSIFIYNVDVVMFHAAVNSSLKVVIFCKQCAPVNTEAEVF